MRIKKMCKEKNEIKFGEFIKIKSDIDVCPKCKGSYFDASLEDFSSDMAWVRCVCDNCDFYWDVGYSVSELYIPEQ